MAAKILIVEDDKNLNLMLKLIFKTKNYDWELETAHSGDEALRILERFTPQVAVLDIMLPGMDGIQLAKKIRQDPRLSQVKMAAFTALEADDVKKKALAAGITEFWVKPVVAEKLLADLARLLAKMA